MQDEPQAAARPSEAVAETAFAGGADGGEESAYNSLSPSPCAHDRLAGEPEADEG